MTSNDIHASESGFIVSSSPNVNAMYGPWNSVAEAKDALAANFRTLDDNYESVTNIPTGTTVAVYDKNDNDLVTEYWWIKDELILKTYGNNYYELVIKNEYDQKVTSVIIKDGSVEPKLLKILCVDNSTDSTITIGEVKYSIDGGEFESVPSTGIRTNSIKNSIIFEWRDDAGKLILFKDLNVITPPTVTQTFYAYNNDENLPPEYITGSSDSNYLTYSWTPNTEVGSNTWDVTRKGVSRKISIEWAISRTRINGLWEPIMGPSITASFGKDGSNLTNQLNLWAYTISINDNKSLNTTGLPNTDGVLQDSYTCGNTTWFSKFLDLTSDTRYCFVVHRYKYDVDGVSTWSEWTDPALYTALPMDGTDSPTTEYIYCLSKTIDLDQSVLDELDLINNNCATDLEHDKSGYEFAETHYWKADPQGIDENHKYEFFSCREKATDANHSTIYGKFSLPKIWTAFGKDGPDGPGVEYIYKLTSINENRPSAPESLNSSDYIPSGWEDNPLEVSYAYPILWMSLRKKSSGVWGEFSVPVIWNQFSLNYDLKLSNENCSIPSAVDGSYTADAAKAATLTEATLYLGSDIVDSTTYEIEVEGYEFDEGLNKYYLSDGRSIENPINVTFTAKINKSVVASKNLTVLLSRGLEAYSLQIIPNNRIWYGGNSYSTTEFWLHLYKITTLGTYEEVDSLDGFGYYYLYSNDTDLHSNTKATKNITINGGESSSVYFTLTKNNTIIDKATISCVDYNNIKGEDNVSVLIGGIEKNISIPISKANSIEYIKSRTKSTPKAYINVVEIPSEKLEISAEANYIESITSDSIKLDQSGNTFWVNSILSDDASVIYTVKVTMDDGTVLEYTETLIINLTADTITYDLFSDTDVLMYDDSGVSQDVINFTVVPSEGDISDCMLKYWFDNEDLTDVQITESPFAFSIPDEIKSLSSGEHLLHFELYVDGVLKDTLNIQITSKPQGIGYNYTIDLTNPYIQVPVGVSGEVLKTWTFNEFSVYQGDQPIEYKETGFPRFEVKSTNNNVDIDKNTSYLNTIPTKAGLITYLITVYEREGVEYTFTKTQSVQLTNSEAYLIVSNPDKVVAGYQSNGNFMYNATFNILKDGVINSISTVLPSGFYYTINDTAERLSNCEKRISYGADTNNVVISLYKGLGDPVLVDLDTIPIIRNGAPGSDGIATKIIYGRSTKYYTSELLSNYEDDPLTGISIVDYKGDTFTESLTDYLNIEWYDSPKGINDTYKLEFLSVSNYNGTEWSYFSKPTIYSELGKRGEDGDGILYSFIACESCTFSNEDFEWYVKISTEKESFTVDLEPNQKDNATPDKWLDNIPSLTREDRFLYMISRKKSNNLWTRWSDPILWNKYSSDLELLIDNNIVIIDDDSDQTTLLQVSLTNIKIYYVGTELDLNKGKLDLSVSEELSQYVKAVNQEGTNSCYLEVNEGARLLSTSGLVTYSFTYNDVTVTAALLVLIKNFSAGEAYKLILEPNVLSLTYDNGKYSWQSTPINIKILKIQGNDSTYVTDGSASLQIKDSDNGIISSDDIGSVDNGYRYTISQGQGTSAPSYTFEILKNEIVVESLTLQGTLQGKNGEPGVPGADGASFRLRGLWDSSLRYCFKSDIKSDINSDLTGWTTEGTLYIDVVYIIVDGAKKFYQTIQDVPLNKEPPNVDYWEEAPGYGTLLTENILITNDEGSISGGMLNKPTENKTILWAGGEGTDTNTSSKDAAFRVTEDGTLFATKGMFSGMYVSKAKELQKFVVSRRIMPELVLYSPDGSKAITPPVLDISELSDVLMFDADKFDFPAKSEPLKDSNGKIIQYPRYTYDENTGKLIRNYVDLYIEGHPVVYLPTGWYLQIPSLDKGWIPYKRLHQFLSVSESGSIQSDTANDLVINFDYNNIGVDAFFAYMIFLAIPEGELFTPGDIGLDSYGTGSLFFLKVVEYWNYKYTEALAYKGKSLTLNFKDICGVTMPIIKSLMFETSNSIAVGGSNVSPIEQFAFNKKSYDNQPSNTIKVLTCTSIPLEGPSSTSTNILYGYLKGLFESNSDYYYTKFVTQTDVNEQLMSRTRQALAMSAIGYTNMLKLKDGDTSIDAPWGGISIDAHRHSDFNNNESFKLYEDGDIWWVEEPLTYNGNYSYMWNIPYQCRANYDPNNLTKNFSIPYVNLPYEAKGEFITWNLTSVGGTDFKLRYTPVDLITVACEFDQKDSTET